LVAASQYGEVFTGSLSPPVMKSVTILGGMARVLFGGPSDYQYQLLRSTNLMDWTVLTTITMPTTDIYTNTDLALPSGRAFYRAEILP